MSKYPDALMIQESIGAPQDNHHHDQGTTDGINLMVNKVNTTIDAPSTLTVFHEQEDRGCHHSTHKHLLLSLNRHKECSFTAPTCRLRHDAPERHHNLGALSVITVFGEQEASMYHHTYNNLFHNLLFKYEAPEYHHTVCSLIHHLLFKHDMPECHLTTGSLIHHLHE